MSLSSSVDDASKDDLPNTPVSDRSELHNFLAYPNADNIDADFVDILALVLQKKFNLDMNSEISSGSFLNLLTDADVLAATVCLRVLHGEAFVE